MNKDFGYIPKDERKKILLLCDDLRMHSGVATMAREFVVGTAQHFNWYQLGAAINHPDSGKIFDLSTDINNRVDLEDASVFVEPYNGYGDAQKVRQLIEKEKPDAILIFTDPRYWTWLFQIEREIRSKMPIFWLNIWDDLPAPMYNKPYYNSVDLLMAISKQTKTINKMVLGPAAESKVIEYVPHGIDSDLFFPITKEHELYSEFENYKSNMFEGKDIEFVLFFNSRNISRKHAADTILAYQLFCDKIGPEKAKKCALLMHTAIVDQHGTDLKAVKEALTNSEYVNIYFSTSKLSSQQMNLLYNIADATVLLTSNEGWGLALTESMMSGTMFVANVTGGMQDQMRFVNEKGEWIDFDSDFPSNHRGTYKDCGKWAIPVFPTNISLAGSPATPYIFDDRCSPEDAASAMLEVWNLTKEERIERGLKGREWAMSDEAQITGANMSRNMIKCMNKAFKEFVPRNEFDLIKLEERTDRLVPHKLTDY